MFISQQQPIGFSKRERLLTEPLLLHQKVTHWCTVTGDSMLITIQDRLNQSHRISFSLGDHPKHEIWGSSDTVWWVRMSFADNTERPRRQILFVVFLHAVIAIAVVLIFFKRRREELFIHFHIHHIGRAGDHRIQACQGHISGVLGWLQGGRWWQSGFPFQELVSSPCISPPCRWAFPILNFGSWRNRTILAASTHWEVEGGADGEGEGESLALAGQRLAEIQTLGGQGRAFISHRSHFQFKSELMKMLEQQNKSCCYYLKIDYVPQHCFVANQ